MTRRHVLALPALSQVLPESRDNPRWIRLWWYMPGLENGNPVSNRRFRVNSPDVVLHPTFGSRSEVRSSGMLQILVDEPLRSLSGAELYLELWGGHPGTMHKRVTPNGRTTYWLPEVGTAAGNCTHQYPTVKLKITDLVSGHNAFQFACDQGPSFWGHFIVEQACVRCELPDDHADLKKFGLSGFTAEVLAEPAANGIDLGLRARDAGAVERVEYRAWYTGYDENGNGQQRDWHGFTKNRVPMAIAGSSSQPPFRAKWDTSMLPAQSDVSVRASVYFRERPNLVYESKVLRGLHVGGKVKLYGVAQRPVPFWSRAKRRLTANIPLDVPPSAVERAELHIVVWDGGRGEVNHPFTLNGHAVEVVGEGKHDVIYTVAPVKSEMLRQGANEIVLLSDTEHHGIEILEPGPALMLRTA